MSIPLRDSINIISIYQIGWIIMTQTSTTSQGVIHQTIDDNHAGQRLDNYLLTQLKGVPKSRIYNMIRKGEVRVNKKRAKPMQKLLLTDVVRIPPVSMNEKVELNLSTAHKQKILDAIVFQDDNFIVIDKPAGMAVHGGSGLSIAVIEGLRLALEQPNLELAHRLDKDTSGCLLIAKNRKALTEIHEKLRLKQVKKRYLALLSGHWHGPKQRVITVPLLKNTLQGGERIVRVDKTGKDAETMFQLLENFEDCCLVAAYPLTGRTHQIRVHAQSMGHPIIGDKKYGLDRNKLSAYLAQADRLYLHANQLKFSWTPKAHFFEVPPDASWQKFIEELL